MSVIKANGAGSAGADFYTYKIGQSLRFNDGDSPLLHITPGSAGSRTTWTYSCWVKRSNLGSYMGLLAVGTGDGSEDVLKFEPNNTLNFRYDSGSDLTTSMLFRDVSAWYHIVVVADTTQSQNSTTASDSRLRFYVNGSQITDFSSTQSYASQNFEFRINTAAQHYIGEFPRVNDHLDGYLAEVNFIDGTAYDASNFGETKDGVWVPKSSSGLTFGTNGFYLPFDDSSAIGDDESSNTNDFTVANLAATDVVLDSPTNTFCTLNSLTTTAGTYSEGNTRYLGASAWRRSNATHSISSGKWYWEYCVLTAPYSSRATNSAYHAGGFCLSTSFNSTTAHSSVTDGVIYTDSGYFKNFSGSYTSGSAGTITSIGDIIGFAVNLEDNTFTIYKNNSSEASGTIGMTAGTEIVPLLLSYNADYGIIAANFGQDSSFAGAKTAQGNADGKGVGDFFYAPPSGFLAVCTKNLPDPTIGPTASTIATDNFNTVLWTGNGSSQNITGVGFQPDWLWIKNRTNTDWHNLIDVVRGSSKRLASNNTTAEYDDSSIVSGFASDGFGIGSNSNSNKSGYSFVGWNWKAGGSASSNSDGTITSSVSANVDAGFSIVSYTGTGSAATIGHGLNAVPEIIIAKVRSTTNNWATYVKALGNTKALLLDTTDAGLTSSLFWNNTTPTSSVFSVSTGNSVNNSGQTYIAYCFHSVEGYSKVSSYTGNSDADGTFVLTGFRPTWIMIKCTNATESWNIFDTARDPSNLTTQNLNPNVANAESDASSGNRAIDILSNGFKCRGNNSAINNGSYIYLAFAESPFKFANAR